MTVNNRSPPKCCLPGLGDPLSTLGGTLGQGHVTCIRQQHSKIRYKKTWFWLNLRSDNIAMHCPLSILLTDISITITNHHHHHQHHHHHNHHHHHISTKSATKKVISRGSCGPSVGFFLTKAKCTTITDICHIKIEKHQVSAQQNAQVQHNWHKCGKANQHNFM